MKKYLQYKILYVFFLFAYFTNLAQTNFEKANNLYQKANYNGAILEYQNILKTNTHSAEVYFNLGNSYYKLNQVAPAIYYFEKALLLNPNDSEIQNNLSFAQKMTIDEILPAIEVGFEKIVSNFTNTFHFDTWAILVLVCVFLIVISFGVYYFSYHTFLKRIFFTGIILFSILFLLSLFSALFEKNKFENNNPAIVFAEVCSVKSEPRATSTESFVLHAGAKVNVIEKLNNYKKIQLPDQKTGWVNAVEIKEIKSNLF